MKVPTVNPGLAQREDGYPVGLNNPQNVALPPLAGLRHPLYERNLAVRDDDRYLYPFSTFGQRGETPSRRVLPTDWPNEPFKCPASATFNVPITPSAIPLLRAGFCPRDIHAVGHPRNHGEAYDETQPTAHRLVSRVTPEETMASEDKWFIYSSGIDRGGVMNLHFHRSWTGIKAFELVIDVGSGGAHHEEHRGDLGLSGQPRILYIVWEAHPHYSFRGANESDMKEVARRVCHWVLSVTVPFEDMPLVPRGRSM